MALRSDQRTALTVSDERVLAQRMRNGHPVDVGHGDTCCPRFRLLPL